ncbi:cell wall hydrolase [Methylopila sp. M107]|uniref:cell wall hydrolase n=1 Tax=Methylopila sp. M107 TaxID=1101190 RepID=UPI0003705A0C|nr:cell wall hydrolase [Methylopila sp. M107]
MRHRPFARLAIASAILLSGVGSVAAGHGAPRAAAKVELTDRECMARAMYFESNRNREDGMLAVGTIVANRLASGRYGSTVCGVVGQYLQFAPGVLTRRMTEQKPAEKARRVAEAVLNGLRHPAAGDVMFFHTANVPFRNDDKTYVLVSGGNAFYRWNRSPDDEIEKANLQSFARAFEEADQTRKVGVRTVAKVVPQNPDEAPVLKVATLAADPVAPLAPVEQAPAEPELLRPVAPQLITVAAAEVPQIKVAQEIVDGRSDLSKALAFRGEPTRTPAANEALSVVMSLAPPRAGSKALAYAAEDGEARRVIAPSEPVLASAAPIFRPRGERVPNPMANFVVAQAWSGFD